MTAKRERILLVESDPEISDLISRQTLNTLGYQVHITRTVANALQEIQKFLPDIIITNLHLPDLSGKDLLVALNAQGIEIPVIVIAEKGMEADLISALRLGAADYCLIPTHEVEIVSAVDRVQKQIQSLQERETISQQLKQTNFELQQRVRELTTIINIGKAVTSITAPKEFLKKIVDGAIYVSSADLGWFLLRHDNVKVFHLEAYKNLPGNLASLENKPWDDGISALVALSGKPLSVHGNPIKKLKISQLGQSALVVPVKIRKEVIGLLVVMRKQPIPFTSDNITLVEAIADYASISLANARLFQSLEERSQKLLVEAHNSRTSQQNIDELLLAVKQRVQPSLSSSINLISGLLSDSHLMINETQKSILNLTMSELRSISNSFSSITPKTDTSEKQ